MPKNVMLGKLLKAERDLGELRAAVREYVDEKENTVAPDFTMRRILFDRMKSLVR